MKNLHVPLPEDTYNQLRAFAEESKIPATVVAREAIDAWLKTQQRQARAAAIAEYARNHAGSAFDLDPQLEAAAAEHLANTVPVYK